MAGLTIAYQLSTAKYENTTLEITVFEADHRIGGRIYTLRNFASGLYAEAGAMSFTDMDNELIQLINQLGLEMVELSHKYRKKYHDPLLGNISYSDSKPAKLFKKYILNNIPKTINDLHAPENTAYDHISMLDFLKLVVDEDASDDIDIVINAIKVSLLGMYCDDLSKISALNAFRWINQYTSSTKVFAIKNGNDELIAKLENALKANNIQIKLENKVIQVNRPTHQGESTPVVLTAIDESGKHCIYEYDYVVIAVPLNALQKTIRFYPELPKEYQVAINSIPYNTSIARVYFQFDQRFWLNQNDETAMTIQPKPTVWIEDHTCHSEGQSAIIEVHASSEIGKSYQTDAEVLANAKSELIDVWGEEVITANMSKQPPKLFLWNNITHQSGAYPYLGLGQAMFPLIFSGKLPALSFAGEYTSIFSAASMNGAIQSANRVSAELMIVINAKYNHVVNDDSSSRYPPPGCLCYTSGNN